MAKSRRKHARHKRAHNRFRARRQYRMRAHNPLRRSHRRRHRAHNPFKLSGRGIVGAVTPALVGAGGAVLTDVAMAYAAPYLPASLASGWMNILTRAVAAVGVGFVAGKIAGKRIGQEVGAGGLIVVGYSAIKTALAPTLGTSIKGLSGLADFGDYQPTFGNEGAHMMGSGMGAYMQPRLGAYMPPRLGRLGAYMSPGSIVAPSPIRQKQLSGFGGFGAFNGHYSDDM